MSTVPPEPPDTRASGPATGPATKAMDNSHDQPPRDEGTASTTPRSDTVPIMSAADRTAVHAFRPRRTLPSVIVSVLLILFGVVVAIGAFSTLAGRPAYGPLLNWASATPWQNPPLLIGAAIAVLIGLWLIVLALRPGRPSLVPLHTGDQELVMGMRRRSFARSLAQAAEAVSGINRAKVRLGGGSAHVIARTRLHDTRGLAEKVRHAVETQMHVLGPISSYPVRVDLRGE
ncbi:DUF6286 domain-containing protein [Sinosporangium siamense]|uniref:DUF6286 domain-containing protein n=1 Tax=Sinosporangium siamense TaxID=1367973 RepID=A0A919RFF3_9ACTN|nr:DUF6286 domain-containing protein [Sinosporangium siamense]GII92648.1 hypothetical protein Ssi02_28790 [Sinosporangium siamense]